MSQILARGKRERESESTSRRARGSDRLGLRNDQLGSSYADLFTGVIFDDDEASV